MTRSGRRRVWMVVDVHGRVPPPRAPMSRRAAQLVKPGGTLVGSTFMNPVEDEAVVAELLRADLSLR